MKFEYRVTVDTDIDTLWSIVMDVQRASACIPGLVRLEAVSPTEYTGAVRVRVGPVGLEFNGVMTIEEADEANRRCVYSSAAKDKKVPGKVTAHTILILEENPEGGTDLVVNSEAKIMGKLGEFGQSMIKRKSDALVQECTENLVALINNQGNAVAG